MPSIKRYSIPTLIVLLTIQLGVAGQANAQGDFLWVNHFGGDQPDNGVTVATDSLDNIVVAGSYQKTIDLGGGAITGRSGLFLAKNDSTGAHIWSRIFEDPDPGHGGIHFKKIAIDSQDNIVVSGDFSTQIDLGGGLLMAAGYHAVFLAKFDADGNHLWSKHFSGPLFGNQATHGNVAVDAQDHIIFTGQNDSVDFGGGALNHESLFLVKFDGAGNHIWSRSWSHGGFGVAYPHSVAIDGFGNIHLTGLFFNIATVGGEIFTAQEEFNVFVAKYDSTGNHLWSFDLQLFDKQGENPAVSQGNDITIDDTGNVLVTGTFGTHLASPSPNALDIFIGKYDADGNRIWFKTFGGVAINRGFGIAVDSEQNVAVTGSVLDVLDFGGGPLPVTDINHTSLFIAVYDASGAHLWSRTFGDDSVDTGLYYGAGGSAIVADSASDLIVTGAFHRTIDFGGGPIEEIYNATSLPTLDAFLVKFAKTATEPGIGLNPVRLTPFAIAGNDALSQTFTVRNSGVKSLDYSISDDVAWLSVSPATGSSVTEQDTIAVDYATAALAPGTYATLITISDPAATNTPQTVSVTLTVTGKPVISLSTLSLAQSVIEGQNALSHIFTVRNSGESPLNYAITDNVDWLSVSPATGSLLTGEMDPITVTYATTTFAPGTHTALISIVDPVAANSPQTIFVALSVVSNPNLSVSPTALNLTVPEGANHANHTFIVSNSGTGTLNYSITDDAVWFSVVPASGTSTGESDTLTMVFGTALLPAGTHNATIRIDAPGAQNSPRDIPVSLVVTGSGSASTGGGGGGGGGGCFIATATYGTPMAEEIDTLRSLRDRYLLQTSIGAAFVDTYYRISPPAADYISRSPALRAAARLLLAPVLWASDTIFESDSATHTAEPVGSP